MPAKLKKILNGYNVNLMLCNLPSGAKAYELIIIVNGSMKSDLPLSSKEHRQKILPPQQIQLPNLHCCAYQWNKVGIDFWGAMDANHLIVILIPLSG